MTVDQSPPSITIEDLASLLKTKLARTLVDVRREAAYRESKFYLPSARRGDPEQIHRWAPLLPAGPVIVYCVHGHEVSQNAATWLIQHGYDARYLAGGIERWQQAGYTTILKTEGDRP